MRVLIALLSLVLSFNTVLAQEESSHMKFMGIPMDCCGIKAFAKKLQKEKGLKKIPYVGSRKGINLKGSFAEYNDCTFLLIGNSDCVASVGVFLPPYERWASIFSNYNSLKNRLISKYGEPSLVNETFGNYESSTDSVKLAAIKEGNAFFESDFELEGGKITLAIRSSGNMGYVELGYTDWENGMKYYESITNDL